MAESVSIIHLMANPKKYHKKQIMVTGFLVMELEGNAIYLHKDDYAYHISKNGLWCEIDVPKYQSYNKKYVSIEGEFDADNTGHLGLWSGTIKKISRIWEPLTK
jgi:hypothetical protein